MKHLPPGMSTGEEQRNYEVPMMYLRSTDDLDTFSATAKEKYPEDGDLAFLRQYFDEVIWPAALEQQRVAEKVDIPKLRIHAGDPPGKEAWIKASIDKAADFVRKLS